MATNFPKSGANNAPQYQMSGIPFVTSSADHEVKGVHSGAPSPEPININFDYVTKWIEIENTDSGPHGLRVAFTKTGSFAASERLPGGGTKAAGDHGHYIVVAAGQKVKYDFRCKSLFFVSNTTTGDPNLAGNSSSFTLRAGLTTIPASNFPVLTGSISGTSAFEGVG